MSAGARGETVSVVRTVISQNIGIKPGIDYEPFGAPLFATPERLTFIGKEKDSESDLGDFGVRKYDDDLGRFLSVDPLWEKFRGWSPYHYSYNNPVRFQDGNGKVPGGGNEPDTPHEIEGSDKETSVIKKVKSEVETVKYIAESKVETVKHIAVNVAEGVENSIKEYGLKSYKDLKKEVKGLGLEVHHLIEKRFAKELGVKEGEMLSIALTKEEHQVFTNIWRDAIKYGEKVENSRKKLIETVATRIYEGFDDILKELNVSNGLKK